MMVTTTIGRHHETGERILALTRSVPDGAPPAYRSAWMIRAKASSTGRCPSCGATMQTNRHERRKAAARGEPAQAVILHEAWCAASDDGLERAWVSGAN